MNKINADHYQLAARIYPGLLVLAPAILFILVVLLDSISFVRFIFVILSSGVIGLLLSHVVRDFGKRREENLFRRWGGVPSVAIFRYRDNQIDPITKARYHKNMTKLVKGSSAPTSRSEKNNPENADAVYSAWSNFLRAHTRDKDIFDLLYKENINYGTRRNIWGLRPIGIAISLTVIAVCAIRIYLSYKTTFQFDESMGAAGFFALGFFALWLFYFRADWVKVPADAYAARLVECIEILSVSQKEKT